MSSTVENDSINMASDQNEDMVSEQNYIAPTGNSHMATDRSHIASTSNSHMAVGQSHTFTPESESQNTTTTVSTENNIVWL